jgi:hypothetical protein
MRQAKREISSIEEYLEGDIRFSQLTISVGTSNLGKDIFVFGSVPDISSRDHLKLLIERRISPKFRVRYRVDILKENVSDKSGG